MKKFDLKKAILENKATFHSSLKEDKGLTPFQQEIYDFEEEISGEDFAAEEIDNIRDLNNIDDVENYYANYRGWEDDSSLNGILRDLIRGLAKQFPDLAESKIEEAMDVAKDMTDQETAGHAERFAKYMSGKEGGEFAVTAGSVEGPSFDLDLNGEKYDGGSYIILTNGDIVNMAVPNKPVYANISMLNEDDTEDNIGDETETEGMNEEKSPTKMKKSEFKNKIKEMVLAEMEKDVNISDETPENEEDFLAEIEAMLAEADEETPAEDETAEDETAVDDTEVAVDGEENIDVDTTAEVDPNVKAVQDSLTQAQAAAQKLGDAKLTDQIGNTITFFTRSHVVDKGAVAEGEEKELEEGVWSFLPDRVPEFVKAVEELKDEYHGVVGDDDIFDHLDGAIRRAEELRTAYDSKPERTKFTIPANENEMEEEKESSMKIKEVVFPMWTKLNK